MQAFPTLHSGEVGLKVKEQSSFVDKVNLHPNNSYSFPSFVSFAFNSESMDGNTSRDVNPAF